MFKKILLVLLVFIFSVQTVFALCSPDGYSCSLYYCCSGYCDPVDNICKCAPDFSYCIYNWDCCSGQCDQYFNYCLPGSTKTTQPATTSITSTTISSTTTTTQPQCNEGNYRCIGQNLERCTSGAWQFVQSCTYGCLIDHCTQPLTTTSTYSTTTTTSTTATIPTTTTTSTTTTIPTTTTTSIHPATSTTQQTTTTIFSTTSSTINPLPTTSIPQGCFKSNTCGSCTSTASCGWCKNKNQCKIGNSNGPNDNSCSGNDWIYYSDQCSSINTSSQQQKILLILITFIKLLIKNPLIAILLLIILIIFLSNKRFIYKKLKV
jgi:hypothetical protein